MKKSKARNLLERAGVRYRNPYQTRNTFASMMLSAGENIMWVASQMGHVDTEMVMKTYGKWIPDNSLKLGYKPLNNWGTSFDEKNPLKPRRSGKGGKNTDKPTSYMGRRLFNYADNSLILLI